MPFLGLAKKKCRSFGSEAQNHYNLRQPMLASSVRAAFPITSRKQYKPLKFKRIANLLFICNRLQTDLYV
jgi:hypothetical protein